MIKCHTPHTLAAFLSSLLQVSSLQSVSCGLDAPLPNVVIVYADDVGWGDLSCYGASKIETPNLDKLAAGGVRFTDAHCTSSTCTPSRYGMLTGKYPFREGIRILPPNAPLIIPQDTYTLADLFKSQGYSTGVVGKWHLGLGDGGQAVNWNEAVKPGPIELGFDYSFLLPSTNDRVPCVYLENHHVVNLDDSDPLYVGSKPEGVEVTEYPNAKVTPEAMTYYKSTHGHNDTVIGGVGRIGHMWGGKSALWDDETMADVFVEKAEAFVKAKVDQQQPFFLYFASQDIHVPRMPHKRFHGKSGLGYRGDALLQLDYSVGAIQTILEKYGVKDNTMVIFSSDNGPVYNDGYADGSVVLTSTKEVDQGHDGSGPYRGGKYQIYEGGTRVPFIVSWPEKIIPGVSDELFSQIDLMASFGDFFNLDLSNIEALDSKAEWNALLGGERKFDKAILEESFFYDHKKRRPYWQIALRVGDWKYIEVYTKEKFVNYKGLKLKADDTMLFNLDSDLSESNNLSSSHPAKLAELSKLYDELVFNHE